MNTVLKDNLSFILCNDRSCELIHAKIAAKKFNFPVQNQIFKTGFPFSFCRHIKKISGVGGMPP